MRNYLDLSGLRHLVATLKDTFVEKEAGKSLSTNDYTNTEKEKVSNIPTSVSHLENDTGFQTSLDVDNKISTATANMVVTVNGKNGPAVNLGTGDITVDELTGENLGDRLLALSDKAEKIHAHAITDIGGLSEEIEELKKLGARVAHIEEGSELTVVASDPDADGVYTTVTWTRRDGTTYAESTLSGDPYNLLTAVYYDKTGTGVEKTIAWALTIDANGIVSRKELI